MNSPRLTNCLSRFRLIPWLIAVACGGNLIAAAATKMFNLPADAAERALRQFSTQAGVEVLFATETAAGVRTQAVNGSYTPLEAAQHMLAGTTLAVTQDTASGALVVSRRTASAAPARSNLPRPADVEADPGGGAPQKMEPVEVTGSRIRGLLGDATIQPTMILSNEDIERSGATSLADAFRYVPEITSYTEGLFVQSPNAFGADSGSVTSPRVSATLRGAPAGGTLLLINGRRAPKNGQEFSSQEGYDLSGIPLAAIERVEVLLDGASAIYGNDAVGGVINVILKRGYRNTEVKVGYENTFDGDSHVFTASLNHGFSKGKLSGTITLNNEQSGNLMWKDRDFLRTQDRRQWGGTNNPAAQIPSGNGSINLTAGNSLGLPAGTLLTIPAGSNGTNKTAAQYQANGIGAPPGTDLAIWAAYNSPYERRSAAATLEYDLKPWITAFAEMRGAISHSEQTAAPIAVSSISVPANAPGNVFGVPITMRRYLTDLPIAARWSQTNNTSAVLGVRGRLPHDWRFESSFAYTNTRPEYIDPLGFSISASKLSAALADPDPTKRPNLFYDATTPGNDPNAPGVLASLGTLSRQLESDYTSSYNLQGDGPVAKLWSGDLRVALGTEYREEHVRFPLQNPPGSGTRPRTRYVTGLFTEIRVPLVAEKNKIPLVNRLEGTTAFRRDHYQEFASLTKPRYGVLYRPFSWLMFRASKGEGYKIPSLNQLYSPATTTTGTVTGFADIYRGNESFTGPQLLTIGGNPNLQPEQTKTETAGMVFDVPGKWFKGWSFSYDFYDYRYLNRIASPTLADRLLIFPELFVRQPASPADVAKGWPGPFTNPLTYDGRSLNISLNRITGWDASTRYFRSTPVGEFALTFNASKTYRNRNQVRPGAPPAINAVPQALPLKESGSLFWKKGPYETGALFSYRDVLKTTTTQRLTPSSIRWDWRGSFDFSRTKWARADAERWYQRWLADSRVSLMVFNVFDRNPPMNANGLPDSAIVDARGERFSLTYTKSFSAGTPRGRN